MKGALKKYKAWRSRRRLLALQRWEEIRAQGQARFVVQTALTFSLAMIGMMDVLDHIGGGSESSTLVSRAIFSPIGGIIAGFGGWSDMEAKYHNALNEARANASSSGQLPPQSPASQISD